MSPIVRTLGIVSLVLVTALGARAQQPGSKHPRVAELENAMTKDASAFLKGRFPDLPFFVTVAIDPVHRYDRLSATKQSERLPYYDVEDEEIRDEWDDPAFPEQGLMARVRKAVVSVSVPNTLTDDEVAEIQQNLSALLNLTPARDEVQVQKRNWQIGPDLRLYGGAAAAALVALLLGLFLITRGSIAPLARALQEATSQGAKNAGGPVAPPPSPTLAKDTSRKGLNDVKFSDPIKTREVISKGVRLLAENPAFPNLRDMIIIDRFGAEHPAALGAIVMEFPLEVQKKLFSYSFADHWLHAFAEPGDLDSDCLALLQTLIRQVRDEDTSWQKLLLTVWRLGDERVTFIRSLPQEEALAVLGHLPKTIAVGTARAAFPGSWGVVLDPNFRPKNLSRETIEMLAMRGAQVKPLREFTLLEKFLHERDLLDYLKTSEPGEERDVYGASPQDSMIHQLRPPFFKVLELDDASLDQLVPRVSLDDWSLALFNIGKNERRSIEKRLSDKQRFMLFERFKAFDGNPPAKQTIGDARERIARYAQSFLKNNVVDLHQEEPGDEAKAA